MNYHQIQSYFQMKPHFFLLFTTNISTININEELKKKKNVLTAQWKVSFNSDPTKQVHEVIVSRKKPCYPTTKIL